MKFIEVMEVLKNKYGKDLKNKKILIVNQTNTFGKPLAKELIDLGASVFIIDPRGKKNGNFPMYTILQCVQPQILITASNQKNFKINSESTKNCESIIDLSNDTMEEDKHKLIG